MASTITISPIGLVAIILAGVVVGFVFGRSQLGLAFSITKLDGDGQPKFAIATKTVRSLTVKCNCGATWKFHETGGNADQGSQPMPEGDSFTCPKCGQVMDLREAHRIERESMLSLSPKAPNRSAK
jgi:hypothetical protein